MEVIFQKLLKNKVIELIKKIGIGVNEIILEIPLTIGTFQTIEYDVLLNDVILHQFEFEFDYPYLYDDLPEEDKLRIYQILNGIKHLD